jgi:LPXTG-motif cell wall-anchored protein
MRGILRPLVCRTLARRGPVTVDSWFPAQQISAFLQRPPRRRERTLEERARNSQVSSQEKDMSHRRKELIGSAFALVTMLFCLYTVAIAQQTSTQETVPGQATTQVTVRSGEVVTVDGNKLFVKMEDGQVKEFDVPPDAKFNVDGNEVTVDQLTPGTKLTQSIQTTTTPHTVKTVTTIKGKVWHVSPPNSIILALPDGTNRQYHIPKGQKFNVSGQQVDAFALKKGMNIDATVTQEVPEEVVSEQRSVTGQAPPAPEPPKETAQAQPAPEPTPAPQAQAPEEPAKKEALPQTASPLPLLALVGVLLIGAGALTSTRKTR